MVLKLIDGTHGVGVMIIDSFQSLKSVVEVLVAKKAAFVFQEFIKESQGKTFRVIVLNGKVVGSVEYNSEKEDFRSNASDSGHLDVNTANISSKMEEVAVQAVQSLGVSFGGVDLLPANNKEGCVVAEANLPCNFARVQAHTKTDISGMILDYLINKYKKS